MVGIGCEPGKVYYEYTNTDLPADSRFEGEYVSTLEGEECGDDPTDICETTLFVAHTSQRTESEESGIRYHTGTITLNARQTGNTPYQSWAILLMNGAVQERGRATGTLFTFGNEEDAVGEEHSATVTLEGDDECPGTIRIATDDSELEVVAERTGECLGEG
jgi:hypothetical protein